VLPSEGSSVAVALTSVSVSAVGSSIGAIEGYVVVVGAVSIVVEDVGSTVGAGEAVVVGSPVVGGVVDSCSAIVGIVFPRITQYLHPFMKFLLDLELPETGLISIKRII
jgi:hypothetical protein